MSSSEACRETSIKIDGIQTYLQPLQDLTVEDRVSRTQYQFSVEDASASRARRVNGCAGQEVQDAPRPSPTSPATSSSTACKPSSSSTATPPRRLGITPQNIDDTLDDAFGQRQVSTIFTQLNQYHVVLWKWRRTSHRNVTQLDNIYVKSSNNVQVPLSTFTHFVPQLTSLAINHQGQFPSVTISFNLAPGKSIGDAVTGDQQRPERRSACRISVNTAFQGSAASL